MISAPAIDIDGSNVLESKLNISMESKAFPV